MERLHGTTPSRVTQVEYLAAGETKLETFTITLDDGHGGTVSQTIEVTITGTNDAPVLTASTPHLDHDANEDQTHNHGQTVASLLGNSISDADHNAQSGIAITGAESSHGHWEFSIDGGAHWGDVGASSSSSALLLAWFGPDPLRSRWARWQHRYVHLCGLGWHDRHSWRAR